MIGRLRPFLLPKPQIRPVCTPRQPWSSRRPATFLVRNTRIFKPHIRPDGPASKHIGQTRGVRYLGREWTWRELWEFTWRTQPRSVTFAMVVVATLSGTALFFLWMKIRLERQLGPYPKKVGMKLRTAIYYTKISPDLDLAVKYFIQALQAAADEGLDPLSDEVFGIKTECAAALEAHGNPQNSIKLLEEIKSDCLNWIEKHEAEPDSAGRRSKLLAWACRVSTRLADLYSSKYIGDEQKMEEALVWAVETTLRERQRREKEGVKEAEGNWLDDDEFGSQLEDLANMYLKWDKQYFASQLFLNALMIKPEKDCHAVTLMNNVAATISQRSPPVEPGNPPASAAQLRENGRAWANQALALAKKIQPPLRNEECDMGCVAATHNLGEFAEMDGNIAEARQRYTEAGSIAHAIGYEEGIVEADKGLKRLGESRNAPREHRWW